MLRTLLFGLALVACASAAYTSLAVNVIDQGTGGRPKSGDSVTVQYTGTLASNGKKFDSSYDRNEPFTFKLGEGQVIPCWDQGVAKMQKGETAMLHCPANMAYGASGAGGVIPPNADLNFKVQLLSFKQD